MKLHLKLIPGIIGLGTISGALLAADVTTTPYITYTTNAYAPLNHSAPNPTASLSNGVMLALNAQASLLKEMMQEHQKRAADLTQKNQDEKAKWETNLVNELQERTARVQKSIDEATQPLSGTSEPKAVAGDVDDQLVFVSTVESRTEQIRQELSATIQDIRVLSTQIGTNKVVEDITGLSMVLGENQRLVKELQRERFDLELRKLEFRAILKAMQK